MRGRDKKRPPVETRLCVYFKSVLTFFSIAERKANPADRGIMAPRRVKVTVKHEGLYDITLALKSTTRFQKLLDHHFEVPLSDLHRFRLFRVLFRVQQGKQDPSRTKALGELTSATS